MIFRPKGRRRFHVSVFSCRAQKYLLLFFSFARRGGGGNVGNWLFPSSLSCVCVRTLSLAGSFNIWIQRENKREKRAYKARGERGEKELFSLFFPSSMQRDSWLGVEGDPFAAPLSSEDGRIVFVAGCMFEFRQGRLLCRVIYYPFSVSFSLPSAFLSLSVPASVQSDPSSLSLSLFLSPLFPTYVRGRYASV